MNVWLKSDRLKTLAYLMAGFGTSASFRSGSFEDSPFVFVGYMFAGMILPLAAVALALEIGRREQKDKSQEISVGL
jgi:hypothetical protein